MRRSKLNQADYHSQKLDGFSWAITGKNTAQTRMELEAAAALSWKDAGAGAGRKHGACSSPMARSHVLVLATRMRSLLAASTPVGGAQIR